MPRSPEHPASVSARAIIHGALVLVLLVGLGWPIGAMTARAATRVAPVPAVSPLATASVAPADAIAYAALTLDPDSPQWQQAGALLTQLGAAPLLEQAAAALAGLTGAGVGQTPSSLSLLARAFAGEVGIAVTVDPTAVVPTAVDVAVAAAAGNQSIGSVVQRDLGRVVQVTLILRPVRPVVTAAVVGALVTLGALTGRTPATVVDYQGVPIRTLTPASSPVPLVVTRIGDVVLLGTAVSGVERVLDTAAGRRPALATATAFGRLRAELPGDFLAFTLANGPAMRSALVAALDGLLGARSSAATAVESGLAGLAWTTGTMIAANGSTFRVSTAALPGDAQGRAATAEGSSAGRGMVLTPTQAAGLAKVLSGLSDLLALDVPGMGRAAIGLLTAPGASGQADAIARLSLGWLTFDLAVGTTSAPIAAATPADPVAATLLAALPTGYGAAVAADLRSAASALPPSSQSVTTTLPGLRAVAIAWTNRGDLRRIDAILLVQAPATSP